MKTETNETRNDQNVSAQPNLAQDCFALCRKLLAQIENAKAGILAEFRERVEEDEHLLELAVNEAAAVAWEMGFPHLLFPSLAIEKASAVATWHARQQFLRGRN